MKQTLLFGVLCWCHRFVELTAIPAALEAGTEGEDQLEVIFGDIVEKMTYRAFVVVATSRRNWRRSSSLAVDFSNQNKV